MKIGNIYSLKINNTQPAQKQNMHFVSSYGGIQTDTAEIGLVRLGGSPGTRSTGYLCSPYDLLTDFKLAFFSLCINIIGIVEQEAAALWNLAFSRVPRNSEYITQNGTYYDSINDLGNEDLKQYVYRHINAQVNKEDSKGVIFNNNSSLAKAIKNSNELKTEIRNNKENLLENRYTGDIHLKFSKGNLKNAFHYAKVMNIHLDESDNLCLTLFDVYDFNPNSKSFLVRTAREFQEKNKIETYYVMVEMKIPKEEWINY